MVMCRLPFIRILLRPVCNKVHHLHDPGATLNADDNAILPEHVRPESPFPRYKAKILYNLPELLHDLPQLFFPFLSLPGLLLLPLSPCIIPGFGNSKYLQAPLHRKWMFFFFLPADGIVCHLEYVNIYIPGFEDVNISANNDGIFFCASTSSSRYMFRAFR